MTKIGDITVTSIVEHQDGSATVTFDMDGDTMRRFAEIGILKVLMDSVVNHDM